MLDSYFFHLLIIIGIYLILTISLQLSLGYGGLFNLGHIAFFAIGAYASALLLLNGLSFVLCLIISGLLAGLFGFLLAIPTGRLKGEYLALVTMGFSFVIYAVLLNWTSLTNGSMGLAGIPRPNIFGINFFDNGKFFILTAIITIVSYIIINRIANSSFGKVLEASRDNELAARSLGKNTFKLKAVALIISAFFAGLAGSLFSSYINFIDPSSFTIFNLIPILLIIIIGGLATLPGTVLATIFIVLLPEPLRFIGFPSAIIGPMQQIIYALILIISLYFKPKGFYGRVNLE